MRCAAAGTLALTTVLVGLTSSDAVGAPRVATTSSVTIFAVGPTRFLSSGFGYSVAYRTVEHGTSVQTTKALFLYEAGRWRNVTPPAVRLDAISSIDDVAFVDSRHGWVAAYDCAKATASIYRTSDGGQSWQSLGSPAGHSCGGGPTFLSFIDARHGWMEPISPNGPAGSLMRTADGGRTWKFLLSNGGRVGTASLPCLAPIRFVSHSTGWMGRCQNGELYATADGGRHWKRVAVQFFDRADALLDLPWMSGRSAVVSAIVGARPPLAGDARTRMADFLTSPDGGRSWRVGATRPIGECPMNAYGSWNNTYWPASVLNARVWWIVSDASKPIVQVTANAGKSWRTILRTRGLPTASCSVLSVSPTSSASAWVVARTGGTSSGLFHTTDGGRYWQSVLLLKK